MFESVTSLLFLEINSFFKNQQTNRYSPSLLSLILCLFFLPPTENTNLSICEDTALYFSLGRLCSLFFPRPTAFSSAVLWWIVLFLIVCKAGVLSTTRGDYHQPPPTPTPSLEHPSPDPLPGRPTTCPYDIHERQKFI